ncbi:MAG: hypothetical protein JNM33_03960 [Rubrivivax sp.]|nr:hypothetical protein [Rubrivivax sp.]
MKALVIAGWVLFTLEALFVLMLALQQNMGDDAAGRGMATGFAIVLGPIVLLAGALLLWGSRGGPAAAFWAGLCIVSAPVVYGLVSGAGGLWEKAERSLGRAQQGRFDDERLTRMARAIDVQDAAALQGLLASGPLDWQARDRWGRTLLGHAVARALEYDAGPGRPAFVKQLLDAGAPPAANALAKERSPASVSEHELVYHLYGVHSPPALAMLDMVLAAGASPDVLDEDGRPLYFSTYTVLASLEVLARHGADFTRLDPRSDRQNQNALMNAVQMRQWAEALFFLRRGLSPDHLAADGRSARSVLAEVDPPGSTYYGDDVAAHAAFIAELAKRPPPAR